MFNFLNLNILYYLDIIMSIVLFNFFNFFVKSLEL